MSGAMPGVMLGAMAGAGGTPGLYVPCLRLSGGQFSFVLNLILVWTKWDLKQMQV